jgi:quercetin dioxygenase-like cupin family protein
MMRKGSAIVAVLCVVAAFAMLTGNANGGSQLASATPEPGVVRTVLGHGDPSGAPGDVLELVRYTIPPDITLPQHTHPGMQVALVESGTLHYTVVEGEVPLYRAGNTSGTPEAIIPTSGEVEILPGDSFAEPAGVVHFGRNAGPEPVVLSVASLLASGEPPAKLVTPMATPSS